MDQKEINKEIKRRGNKIDRLAKEAQKFIKEISKEVADNPYWFNELRTGEDGRFVDNLSNVGLAIAFGRKMSVYLTEKFRTFIKWVVKSAKEVVSSLVMAMRTSWGRVPAKDIDFVTRTVMNQIGYDTNTRKLVKGGWLEAITEKHNIGEELGRRLAGAIQSRMNLNDWVKEFRDSFLNLRGYLLRHFNTFTQDFFMMIDAAANLELKNRLDLKYCIWSGTVMSETRPFCERNNNQVFTEGELLEMGQTQWQGKKENHNILLDRGGYNCRHILSWISEDLAFVLRPELKTKKAS